MSHIQFKFNPLPVMNSIIFWQKVSNLGVFDHNFYFFWFLKNSSEWRHSRHFVKSEAALSHTQSWSKEKKSLFSSWKSREGDWIWATGSNKFNRKWPLKVDPWRNFWAGNSPSSRSQKQIRYLESARPQDQEYTLIQFCKKKNIRND